MAQPWLNKISNPAQLGGIEISVLDNGAGRGTRIAWINTGTGFRYKVVIDRAMDIADAFYNQHSLTWLSHVGLHRLNPFLIAAWIGSEPLEVACLQPAGWNMLADPKKMNTANGACTDLSATSRQRLNPLYSLIHGGEKWNSA